MSSTHTIEKVTRYASQITRTDGVIRWQSNGQVPPQDILHALWANAHITSREWQDSKRMRRIETAIIVRRYCEERARNGYTHEERAEMRSAFGPDAEVVDVLTGRKVQL